MGYDSCCAVPVFQGYSVPHAIHIIGVGGSDVTKSLIKLVETMHGKSGTQMQLAQRREGFGVQGIDSFDPVFEGMLLPQY